MATEFTDPITPVSSNRITKIKSRDILINLSLLIFSITIALLLCEIALRLMGHNPLYVSPERNRFWIYDAQLGWAHQPGQSGIFETPQFRTSVRINQQGLRDPEHSYDRLNDASRILVLGDSFAWGYGVEESERFSQLLETSLRAEVINAGVSGYSTDQELLWFRNEGTHYDIDLVIVVFAGNDIGDNQRDLVYNIYHKPRFIQEGDQLILSDSPVQRTSTQGRFIYDLSQHSALVFFLSQRYFDLREMYGRFKTDLETIPSAPSGIAVEREPFGLSIALLNEIESLAESKGAKFMIVATDSWWNHPSEESYQDFMDTLQTEGFLVLDVESTAGFEPDKMIIPDDGHWSRAGHEFVAEKIESFIESNQLLQQP
jgi:lysophospholipase L1-like esterase